MSIFFILDMHVQNKKYGNFFFISRLTGKCAAQKLKKKLLHSSSLWKYLHHMVILRGQNKITIFDDISLIWLLYITHYFCVILNHSVCHGRSCKIVGKQVIDI